MQQIKVKDVNGNEIEIERRLPVNGEYWVYISPKEWNFKEPIEPVLSNNPSGWFDSLWDRDNYWTVISDVNENA